VKLLHRQYQHFWQWELAVVYPGSRQRLTFCRLHATTQLANGISKCIEMKLAKN